MVWGDSGEKLGGIVSLSYKTGNQFVEEERNFYKVSRDAIALQNEYDFKQLDLSEEEFRLHVWPELPGSQLKKPLPFEYGWNDLNQKSMIALGRTYAAYGGRKLAFLRLEFENEATDYETFKVHRDARVVVFDEEQNEEVRLDLFGSIMEKDGRFKLFSHVTDRASKEQEEELFHSFRTLGAWPHFERLG